MKYDTAHAMTVDELKLSNELNISANSSIDKLNRMYSER